MPDGPVTGASTLRLAWATDMPVPGPIGNTNTIDDLEFRMENLQAVVTVSPNDPRTMLDELSLHWDSSGSPAEVVFQDAPPGLYTSVVLKLDAAVLTRAFHIHGTHAGQDFEIEDSSTLSISMEASLELGPGVDKTLTIEIGIANAINNIDFSSGLELEHDDPRMAGFRNDLQQSFVIQGETTN